MNNDFSIESLLNKAKKSETMEILDELKEKNLFQKFLGKITDNFLYDPSSIHLLPTIEICFDVKLIEFTWLFWSFLVDYEIKK